MVFGNLCGERRVSSHRAGTLLSGPLLRVQAVVLQCHELEEGQGTARLFQLESSGHPGSADPLSGTGNSLEPFYRHDRERRQRNCHAGQRFCFERQHRPSGRNLSADRQGRGVGKPQRDAVLFQPLEQICICAPVALSRPSLI